MSWEEIALHHFRLSVARKKSKLSVSADSYFEAGSQALSKGAALGLPTIKPDDCPLFSEEPDLISKEDILACMSKISGSGSLFKSGGGTYAEKIGSAFMRGKLGII